MRDTLLLIGRDAGRARSVITTHANRLEDRGVADAVEVALYEEEPIRELRDALREVDSEVTYAVPMIVGHTHVTRDEIPRALSYVPGEVCYCEPLGRSPAIAGAVCDRTAGLAAGDRRSLVLVGFGSSSLPNGRQVVEYQAARLRERAGFDEVVTCYLLQNPAVECARYNVSNEHVVAAPLFLAASEATDREIPAKLELDRGGIAYADPLGDHPRVTDAIAAEVARQRALDAERDGLEPAAAVDGPRPIATDGDGR